MTLISSMKKILEEREVPEPSLECLLEWWSILELKKRIEIDCGDLKIDPITEALNRSLAINDEGSRIHPTMMEIQRRSIEKNQF